MNDDLRREIERAMLEKKYGTGGPAFNVIDLIAALITLVVVRLVL